ncbi:hypothetical protein U2A4042170015 [Corynebacterium striatum]|nr:hypothetical protein U2A4042170015 [Corynebacterium striatum]
MAKQKHISKKRRERMAKALNQREQGLTYERIAEEHGISRPQAYRDVQDALKEITREPAEAVRTIEIRRCEEQHLRLNAELGRLLRNLNASTKAGVSLDLRTVDQVRRIIETQDKIGRTRQRLYGIDTGIVVDASVDVTASIRDAFQTIMEADPSEFEEGIGSET